MFIYCEQPVRKQTRIKGLETNYGGGMNHASGLFFRKQCDAYRITKRFESLSLSC
ncbi:hypothetical protein L1N85_01630 [Paenibacillus alkaliterrae]|uniref:hypothetical protein n=1 Tax=Paenibacillus alkaliterrae TaxID=320909 RepID=UPI001F488C09|nr:hypothetical protein [Paenibacillus alkaliterrae]MCF2937132.1 hypothetical protein [Paenibacillus alkaliterrae]